VSEFAADKEAPVCSREEVVVTAPPETVWDVISKIDEWPRWNADIKEARIEGDLAPRTSFTWKAGPGTIRSTLREVDRPHVLGWTGRTMGSCYPCLPAGASRRTDASRS
jgi:uncharacterized protein YndB with AHSA1/START domain